MPEPTELDEEQVILEIACLFFGFIPSDYWKKAIASQQASNLKQAKAVLEPFLVSAHSKAAKEALEGLTLMSFENGDDDFTYYDVDEVRNRIAELEATLAKGGEE